MIRTSKFYEQAHELSRHYDSTLWTVTTLFITGNIGILTFAYSSDKFECKLSVLGVFLTLVSFFFAASFRALRSKLTKYFKDHNASEDIKYLTSGYLFKQWPIYFFIHLILLSFWFEKMDNKGLVWYIGLIISVIILIFYYFAADRKESLISYPEINSDEKKKKMSWNFWIMLLALLAAAVVDFLLFHLN